MLARLEGQGSGYLLLLMFPSLEFCIFGETEAQGSENVLDWNQGTRDEVEALSFACHMTLCVCVGGRSLPFPCLELPRLSSEEPGYDSLQLRAY